MSKRKSTPKPHKKGSKKRKAGLKGTAALKAAKKGTGSIAKPAGLFGGLLLGSVLNTLMDKVPFLAPVTPDDGKFSIKKMIKPLILAGVGTGIAIVTHKKGGVVMEATNGVGLGLIGAGLISGIKAGTGHDLLALGEPGANEKALEAKYTKEQLNDMAKIVEEQKFKANLNQASNDGNTDNVDGLGKDWGSRMDADQSGMVL